MAWRRQQALRASKESTNSHPTGHLEKDENEPSIKPTADSKRTPVNSANALICPFGMLATRQSDIPAATIEHLRTTQAYISHGNFGRVDVVPMHKRYLNSIFTDGSNRKSIYSGQWELVALKSPLIGSQKSNNPDLGRGKEADAEMHKIPFKDSVSELIYLSAPDLLYHENIVDLLGYFWEPHGNVEERTDAPTLILEFADHGSLRDAYACDLKLSVAAKIDLCIDICRALQTLHEEISLYGDRFGLYHGDLKPEWVISSFGELNLLIIKSNVLLFAKRRSLMSWVQDCGGTKRSLQLCLANETTVIGRPELQFTAKLSDLGSCVHYCPAVSTRPAHIRQGTKGWKAPEVASEDRKKVDTRKQNTEKEEIGSVSPIRAEIFSFGLLVSYILLEVEPVRLAATAPYVSDQNKEVLAEAGPENFAAVQELQASLIQDVLSEFRGTIIEAVEQLDGTEDEIQRLVQVLNCTLRFDPNDRVSTFREICLLLGRDPDQVRKRRPKETVMDSFALSDTLLSIPAVIQSVNSTAMMPHGFRFWLEEHFRLLLEHFHETNYDKRDDLIHQVTLLRSLLSFVPPEVDRKAISGLEHLRQAAELQGSNIAPLYARLASSYTDFTINQYWAGRLLTDAQRGSIFAKEDLQEVGKDAHFQPSAIESQALTILEETRHLHFVAFLESKDDIQAVVDKARREKWDLEQQIELSADHLGGHTNYAPGQRGTTLHWCVSLNNTSAIESLVKAGASPYTENSAGATPWMLAVASRSLPILKIFVEHSSCVDPQKRTISTLQGLYNFSLNLNLACGRYLEERCLGVYRFLWDLDILTRKDVYEAIVSAGPASPKVLSSLLVMDYDPNPDMKLLRGVLVAAVAFADRDNVNLILQKLPRFTICEASMEILHTAIVCGREVSNEIFVLLLDHCVESFDFNRRFTFRNERLELCETEGKTLLHATLGTGKIEMATELLKRGIDATIVSLDHDQQQGQTALGRFLSTRSNYNHLALCTLIKSDFVMKHPEFLLHHAIVRHETNQNIFHQLCRGEGERVHDNAGQQLSSLHELIKHFKAISNGRPDLKQQFIGLLNAEMKTEDEGRLSPLLLAVSSGFSHAIPYLCEAGADLFIRVGVGLFPGFTGATVLHMLATRTVEAWEADYRLKYNKLRSSGSPWIEIRAPIAMKMRRDYEKRTRYCFNELTLLLKKTEQGKEILKEWKGIKAVASLEEVHFSDLV